jgi:transcription elongation factor/antiterminator RfaH
MQITAEGSERWYAIYTKLHQEERANANLHAWKVETFNPQLKERHYTHLTGRSAYQCKPLFPRYIFARFNLELYFSKVKYTRGVHGIVSYGDTPSPVDDQIISLLQSQVGGDGCIQIKEDLNVGDTVVIKEGLFENFIGVLKEKLSDAERVRILLTTVNYQSHVTVEKNAVKKLSKTEQGEYLEISGHAHAAHC